MKSYNDFYTYVIRQCTKTCKISSRYIELYMCVYLVLHFLCVCFFSEFYGGFIFFVFPFLFYGYFRTFRFRVSMMDMLCQSSGSNISNTSRATLFQLQNLFLAGSARAHWCYMLQSRNNHAYLSGDASGCAFAKAASQAASNGCSGVAST